MTSNSHNAVYEAKTRHMRVSVQPEYLPQQSDPDVPRFVWAYHIVITNEGSETVQLQSRHWRITDANGRREEVRGAGVVGEQPILRAGDAFRYSSGCPLPTPSGFMVGTFTLSDQDGDTFEIEIPAFALDLPDTQRALN